MVLQLSFNLAAQQSWEPEAEPLPRAPKEYTLKLRRWKGGDGASRNEGETAPKLQQLGTKSQQ